MINSVIKFFLTNKLVTFLLVMLFIIWGVMTAPFNWDLELIPRDPVPVDAIPDLGENQQIVFTEWPGRSPQDVEDQVTYPLTTALLGVPGVRSVRSNSMFGLSSIYLIFEENVEFYWSRSRILEKLNSLPAGTLPEGVSPGLGPDATALGQVFWYTLEGRDENGNPVGGWDLQELRSIQDFYVRYSLSTVDGVSEVASIGGYVKEYQVDVRPESLTAYRVSLEDVMNAVRQANLDVGAKTVEINRAEYFVRGLGYIQDIRDLEQAVIKSVDNVPVRIADVAIVSLGPATRRGALDKNGIGQSGGVVVARYDANPMQVIASVKDKISEISTGLPSRTLEDGTVSQVTIVPFYDRSGLIRETLGTLEEALTFEILITVLVIIVMVLNLRASFMISLLLPLAILLVFIAMKYTGVMANIVALSGIAIAIGTMVDLGIILTENIIRYQQEEKGLSTLESIYQASAEVSGAIITAVATTIVSFIPVFALEGAEGKLFHPLAFTKTFALIAAVLVALLVLPALAHAMTGIRIRSRKIRKFSYLLLVPAAILSFIYVSWWPGVLLLAGAIAGFLRYELDSPPAILRYSDLILMILIVWWLLAFEWVPVGIESGTLNNLLFVLLSAGGVLLVCWLMITFYRQILSWCLDHRFLFLIMPVLIILLAAMIWMGFSRVFRPVSSGLGAIGLEISETGLWQGMSEAFPGTGKEFMPSLDEGSFLLMPTAMPHAGIEENLQTLRMLDQRVAAIPEVKEVVGKLGRVESALDPAPISMFENVINYYPEYMSGESGDRLYFQTTDQGHYITVSGDSLTREEVLALRLPANQLVRERGGDPLRIWRDHIRSADDIWEEIVQRASLPGVTSAPKLQPIETRLVMLQTGMRAPMGIKVSGPSLEAIETFGVRLEELLKNVPSVKREAVFADRVIGKPYLEIDILREEIARYGLTVKQVQLAIEGAIGGVPLSMTVEGRKRYPIRVRYPRELRNTPDQIGEILITAPDGTQIPLAQLAEINFTRGPQVIRSEETFLTSYVLFDKRDGYAEVSVVNDAREAIEAAIERGEIQVPGGVSYRFSGSFENQVRAEKRLSLIIPLVLVIIFLILYFQFRSVLTSLMVFTGIAVAFGGGFLMIWLYGQSWVADFDMFGRNMRELFQMGTINLSVAVWVGFIALFGIATDDGVLMATYLRQSFDRRSPESVGEVRKAVLAAGQRRVRPAMMTTATTLIALIPILTSTGKGSDIMVPMAIPIFGGMMIAILTIFVVPVLYAWRQESIIKKVEHE